MKLFGKNIEPACEYCALGRISGDKTMILCPRRGIVAPHYSCRKYRYNPLKRKPRRTQKLMELDPKEFEL